MKTLWIAALCLPTLTVPSIAQTTLPAVAQFAFLSGRWTENSADGWEEEYWSPATGGSMVGHFRVVKDGQPVFYEFWALEIDDGKPVFKMKHFNRNLQGWEEKADMVRLSATVAGSQDALFSNADGTLVLRYQRKGDELVSTLRRIKNGKPVEDVFHLHRARE